MVAGGVQSVEEGALYATHPSYYPQFYSTLLPPAPPGSYTSSNYSSSTFSSSGQSSDCSWLRLEGVEGVCGPSPPHRARHPRCTCPSPEALRQARKALAARRVRASRDPRCTCPSPSGSRDASPWSGTSSSPPSTPATASPPPRHPRCTCPDPDISRRLSVARRARSARDLRCTCPSTPTPPPSREPECTCPPHLHAAQQQQTSPQQQQPQPQQPQPSQASTKGRLVHAVLLNYPGSTAISTDHGDFVRLSDSPAKITEPDVLFRKARGKGKRGKGRGKPRHVKSEGEEPSSEGGGEIGCAGGSVSGGEEAHSSQPSSPARRVKDKLCHLRHKMVSGVAALAAAGKAHHAANKENEGRVCTCGDTPERQRRMAPGVVTRVLPPPTPPPPPTPSRAARAREERAGYEKAGKDASFPVEDIPQPLLEDVCSPLGNVPPLSPPGQPIIRENLLHHPITRHLLNLGSTFTLASASSSPTKEEAVGAEWKVPVGDNLRHLHKLSASHGHLDLSDGASLSRTRSLELYAKDQSQGKESKKAQPSLGGSAVYLPGSPKAEAQRSMKKIPYQAASRKMQFGDSGLYLSTPCISSGGVTSASRSTLKVSDCSTVDIPSMSACNNPDYENVAFHNSGGYVMLSKRLLDQWQLSYEACIPPEGAFIDIDNGGMMTTENGGRATLDDVTPSVTITENGHVPAAALPLCKQESDNVALSLYSSCASSAPSPSSPSSASTITIATTAPLPPPSTSTSPLPSPASTLLSLATQHVGGLVEPAEQPDVEREIVQIARRQSEELRQAIIESPRRQSEDLRDTLRRQQQEKKVETLRRQKKEDTWALQSVLADTAKIARTEDGDTDQETDRLLGQQRSDDPGFYDEKGWRRPKTRTVMPRAANHKANGGGATSNGSTPSTPIGQGHQVSANQTPSTPPDMAASNKNKNKKEKETNKKKGRSKEVLIEGVLFRARYLGSTQLVSEGQPTKTTRMMQAEEAVSRIKALAPDGESQPSTEVDLFISTEKIMVLNTDLKEIMMDHALRTISYIADIGDLVVLMARRRVLPTDDTGNNIQKTPKMICHVFESDEAQFIAQSIGQAFQVAYLEFLKANGIEDHSFVKEMDYQEVLNSQEIFGDELQMFAKKELQKEVVVPKMKSEILGVVVVESGWGSMVPTVVIANLSPTGAAAKCGQLNIGDQIIAINGVSLVGLPLSTCQNYIKNTKYNTAVKLTVVPCPPVVEVKIRRPDTKYQLGFSVQNGVICSLLRGGIAERGGVRVGHRIIDINSQSVVAVPHEKIVNLLATSVGEIRMKTMPTSIFRLLTGQETPQYI